MSNKRFAALVALFLSLFVIGYLLGYNEAGKPLASFHAQPAEAQFLDCSNDPPKVKSASWLELPQDTIQTRALYVRVDVCGADDTDWIFALDPTGRLIIAGG